MISFKGTHFPQDMMFMSVRWYLAWPIPLAVVMSKTPRGTWSVGRGVSRCKRTVWVSWRLDKTYITVKGEWHYLYRPVDKHGHTIDFLLNEYRDTAAAFRFLKKAICRNVLPDTITINGSAPKESV